MNSKRRKKIFWVGMLLLWFVAIEAGLRLARQPFFHEVPEEPDAPKTPSIREETEAAGQMVFEQYIGWRSNEYQGQYFHVDSHGIRKTWNPVRKPDEKFRTLYMLGGSTLWGAYVKDEETVPSFLSKILNKNGYPFEVHNFGVGGFTFTQELIQLVTLLREGHRPDLVIFYDGYNDVTTAYDNGKAGINNNTREIREKLTREEPSPYQHLRIGLKGSWDDLIDDILIYKTLSQIRLKVSSLLAPSLAVSSESPDYYDDEGTRERMAQDIIDNYLKSLDFLDILSKAYGFQYFCFWQPALYTEKKLTGEEEKILKTNNLPSIGPLYQHTNRILKTKKWPHFFLIQDAFEERTQSYYVDFCHLTEKGNEVIASSIFEIIK